MDTSAALFSDDFVWHYYNPNLPDVEGDYVGVEGLKQFFGKVAGETGGSFKVKPVSATPIGEELVVVHTRNNMVHRDKAIAIDVVVVWRMVDGKISEGWDIPSAFTLVA